MIFFQHIQLKNEALVHFGVNAHAAVYYFIEFGVNRPYCVSKIKQLFYR